MIDDDLCSHFLVPLTKKGKAVIGGFMFSVERSGQQFLVPVNTLC